jgi:gamma-glutamyltranspeptidase/glutathione hydrolase
LTAGGPSGPGGPVSLQPVPVRLAPSGMVCAVDHLAAEAGVTMLRWGGSAADAAVAASAVLAVTTQYMCGMGGDLLAVVAAPGEDPVALESAGVAGTGADADRLRAEGRTAMPVPGDVRAATVPGCVDGWLALHRRHGRLPLQQVLGPAQDYSAGGFPAPPALAAAAASVAGLPGAGDFAGSGPGGMLLVGDTVRRPGVARALEATVNEGRDGFYGGEFGAGLLELGAGYFAPEDLTTDLARWKRPVAADAWGHRLWTSPPPSQGYLTVAAACIAAGLDLPGSPDEGAWAHLLAEAARQAGFDRPQVLFEGADADALVHPRRLEARRAAISPHRRIPLPAAHQAGGTIALCAVDADRMGVSLVQSNAVGWGARLVVPGTGIFLHNRGIGFSLEPGHPNEYRPGRRPAHTLSPLVVTRPDATLAAVGGTMGADGQPQVLLQMAARILGAGQDPGEAVAAGRWVLAGERGGPGRGFSIWDEGGPEVVMVEGQAPPAWSTGLRARGHRVETGPSWDASFGHAHWVSVTGTHLVGGSDPRSRGGGVVGY